MLSSKSHLLPSPKSSIAVLVILGIAGGLVWSRQRHQEDRPKTYECQVRGTVTIDGAPLSLGTITFIPTVSEHDGGRPGLARIEPDGTYWIGNSNRNKPAGLRPGGYKVTVVSLRPRTDAGGPADLESIVPERYADPATTPLFEQVRAGSHHIDFALRR